MASSQGEGNDLSAYSENSADWQEYHNERQLRELVHHFDWRELSFDEDFKRQCDHNSYLGSYDSSYAGTRIHESLSQSDSDTWHNKTSEKTSTDIKVIPCMSLNKQNISPMGMQTSLSWLLHCFNVLPTSPVHHGPYQVLSSRSSSEEMIWNFKQDATLQLRWDGPPPLSAEVVNEIHKNTQRIRCERKLLQNYDTMLMRIKHITDILQKTYN